MVCAELERVSRALSVEASSTATSVPDGSRIGAPEQESPMWQAAEVFVAMHDDRPIFGDARADAVGAFRALAPVGAGHQSGGAKRSVSVGSVFSYSTMPLASVSTSA